MSLTDEMARTFELQKSNRQLLRSTSAAERIEKLRRLMDKILARRAELEQALYADLRKSVHEVGLTEIYPVTTEIKHAVRHLKKWMKPVRVSNPAAFIGAKAEIHCEPKGVVLIISPWNFPFQLAMGPLVSAMAAGNCAIVKPSEFSPHTSRFIRELLADIFLEEEIAVFEGDHKVATALLEMPFDHIFFTGSPAVGKIVMRAAAKHLTSVTLELGGKSPVIVDESYDLQEAARKIVWGKFLNAGQTCVAPDYLLIAESRAAEFTKLAKSEIEKFYGSTKHARKASPDYCRIISPKHHLRILTLLEDAVKQGARIKAGGIHDLSEKYLEPTLISEVPLESQIMQEEIFGPVLPIVPFRNLEEAIWMINSRPNPLAFYIFSKNRDSIDFVLSRTRSGGVCINDVDVHFVNVKLPFGGAGHSGIGNSHGYYGFKAFSHERAVLRQPKHGPMTFLYPPYTQKIKKLIDLTIKYL